MSNEISIQEFDGHPIRVFGTPDAPLFMVADICRMLDLENPTQVTAKLDTDERAILSIGSATFNAVTESGLYTLMLRCRDAMNPGTKPYRFRKWVTGDVLPTIRKTDAYSIAVTPALPQNYLEALKALTVEVEAKERLALENVKLADSNAIMVPKAEFFDCAMTSRDAMLIRDAAKLLNPDIPGGMGEKRLFAWMRENGWLFKGNRPYQDKIDSGYMVLTERPVPTTTHGTLIKTTSKLTQTGLVAIRKSILKGFQ